MDTYLTTNELAERLSLSRGTLQNWRVTNNGPPFKKLGKVVRYKLADVLRWLEGKR
jgi:excisionase family DNA binding protein